MHFTLVWLKPRSGGRFLRGWGEEEGGKGEKEKVGERKRRKEREGMGGRKGRKGRKGGRKDREREGGREEGS